MAACEKMVKERLRAPSTYKRIAATPITRGTAILEEFLRIDTPEKAAWRADRNARNSALDDWFKADKEAFLAGDIEQALVVIDYDAANGFGTPLRQKAYCKVYPKKGEKIDMRPLWLDMRADGFNSYEWPSFQLWKLAHPSN